MGRWDSADGGHLSEPASLAPAGLCKTPEMEEGGHALNSLLRPLSRTPIISTRSDLKLSFNRAFFTRLFIIFFLSHEMRPTGQI